MAVILKAAQGGAFPQQAAPRPPGPLITQEVQLLFPVFNFSRIRENISFS